MKGSARLIGVDRQGITRHNKAGHVMQLIQNGAVGNPIGPTVYAARWSLNPLRVADNLLCKARMLWFEIFEPVPEISYHCTWEGAVWHFHCWQALTKSRKKKKKIHSLDLHCGLFNAHTPVLFLKRCIRRVAHTHWSSVSPHSLELGSGNRAWRPIPGVCVIPSLSHSPASLFTTLCPFAPFLARSHRKRMFTQTEGMLLLRQVSTSAFLGTGLLILGGKSTCHEKAGARADIADLYQCSADGITLHLSTVCHQM